MGTQLLPELARESADFNRRIASTVDTEARQLESLDASHDQQASSRRRRAARSARQALRFTLAQVPKADDFWQDLLALFDEGLRGDEARDASRFAREVVESCSELVRSTRELWDVAARAGATPEGLADLDALSRRVEELKAAAEQTHAFLNRPLPTVDPAVLDAAEAAVAGGHYKTPEQIRARLPGSYGHDR